MLRRYEHDGDHEYEQEQATDRVRERALGSYLVRRYEYIIARASRDLDTIPNTFEDGFMRMLLITA